MTGTSTHADDRPDGERRRRVVTSAWLLAGLAFAVYLGFIVFTALTG